MNLPNAVAAYLIEAAVTVANEQNFKPQSEADLNHWLSQNLKPIALNASQLQRQLYIKLFDSHPQVLVDIENTLLTRVHQGCRSNSDESTTSG